MEGYRILNRENNKEYSGNTSIRSVAVRGISVGESLPVIIAGPCAVESYGQTMAIARAVKTAGADMLRAGLYKPRTSPYEFQGMGDDGLEILREVRKETGLPIVSEVMDIRKLDAVYEVFDIIQIGSRNMQNFPLLIEARKLKKPVLLKRGMATTLEELLCAAEYIALQGNLDIILCERGIRCFATTQYSRNTLDLTVIPVLQKKTFLPVIVDPSHSTGDKEMVAPMSRAAIGAGAHGLLIEVIEQTADRASLKCDAEQGIRPNVLENLIKELKR